MGAELTDGRFLTVGHPSVAPLRTSGVQTLWLTPRERHVLARLALPLTLSEIAATLYVSRNTVKSQVRSIYAKLGVADRESAVARARELGVVLVDDPAGYGRGR